MMDIIKSLSQTITAAYIKAENWKINIMLELDVNQTADFS